MIAKIVGAAPVNYISKKTGQPVVGTQLHIVRSASDREKGNGFIGQVTDSIFTRIDCKALEIGNEYEFCYDSTGGRYVELVDIQPVKSK